MRYRTRVIAMPDPGSRRALPVADIRRNKTRLRVGIDPATGEPRFSLTGLSVVPDSFTVDVW